MAVSGKGFLNLMLVIAIVSALVIIAGCGKSSYSNAPQAQPPIKIGAITPLTGDASAYGESISAATMIAVNEINAKGGINGRKIEVIWEDGKCNPKDGAAAAQKLVNVDKVKIILGGACSGETLAAVPITEPAKVIIFSPSASSPDITTAGDFVFRDYPSDAYGGKVAADTAWQLGKKKAAIISENTAYAQGLRKTFNAAFPAAGGTVVADEVFASDANDVRSQVSKAKAASPDMVFLVPQSGNKGLLVLDEMKRQGLSVQVIADSTVVIPPDIVSKNAEAVEGIIGVEPYLNESAPVAAKLFATYKTEKGQDAPYPVFMAAAYDGVYIISDAIAKNGEDSEKIRDYLYGVKNYNGALQGLSIDSNGDAMIGYALKQVRNGKIVPYSVPKQ